MYTSVEKYITLVNNNMAVVELFHLGPGGDHFVSGPKPDPGVLKVA